jgi:glycosyltransferase involved in cell wall biosynthesis
LYQNLFYMSATPLVSVIVPCYNYGKYLAQALDSIKKQTYTFWECIIINDGSTDNTEEVAKGFATNDKRFIYLYQQKAGVSPARNNGLSVAKGEYIQPLDADDMLEPDKLQLHVDFLQSREDVDLVYSDVILFDDFNNVPVLPPLFSKPRVSGKYEIIIDNLYDDNFFLPGCSMFRKTAYDTVGGFKHTYGFEDWEFYYRMAITGYTFMHYSPKGSLLLVRSHDSNTSKKYKKMMEAKINIRKEMIKCTNEISASTNSNMDISFLNRLKVKQKHLLGLDTAYYHLRFGNLLNGLKHLVINALPSKQPYQAFYESAHLIRARLKDKEI